MDADDLSLPHRFAVQMPIIEAGHDLVGAGLVEFGAHAEDLVGTRTPPTDAAAIAVRARFADPFNHPTVVYRREVVRAVGGYTDFALMEDYLLWAKMLVAGARVANVAEPLVRYRVGAGAYARRGGLAQLRAELRLQWRFRRIGFTTLGAVPAQRGRARGVPARPRTGAPGFVSKGHRHLPGVTLAWHDAAVWRTLPRRPDPSSPGPPRPRRTGPLSREGKELLDDDRPGEAVDLLRRAVAAGEPGAPDLLARAYLDAATGRAASSGSGPTSRRGTSRSPGGSGWPTRSSATSTTPRKRCASP